MPRLVKSKAVICECGRPALYYSRLKRRYRGGRADHPLCRQCWREAKAQGAVARAPIPAKRRRERRSARVRDRDFLAYVHTVPCVLAGDHGPFPCSGRIEASHGWRRPLGRKDNDDTCVPLCFMHARQWDNDNGYFKGWTRDQRRDWHDEHNARIKANRLAAIVAVEG